MDDAQRFLRYVVPGLTLMVEFLGYLLISGNISFSQLIKWVNTVGIAVSAFLASGGLGFLLGAIYYPVVWLEWLPTANLGPIVEEAESSGWLKLYSPAGREVKATNLTKRGAWRVVTSYMNMKTETSKQIKGAVGGINRLSNILNALGTTCLASLAALISFVIYDLYSNWGGEFSFAGCGAIVIALIMFIFHCWNCWGVMKDYENVTRSTLLTEFEKEYCKNLKGVKLHVFKNDLKRDCLKTEPRH